MGKQSARPKIYAFILLLNSGGLLACESADKLSYVPPSPAPYCETHDCPNFGHIQGRLCSQLEGRWTADVRLTLEVHNESLTVYTDADGFFRFTRVPTGSHTIMVEGHPSISSLNVILYRGHTVNLGPETCKRAFGTLQGRACGPTGRWLNHAQVSIDLGFEAHQTQTTQDGHFKMENIPAGTHEIKIQKGSFYTSFESTIEANTLTMLPEPICIPHTTTMAVVTGIYDQVQVVLQGLGYSIRDHFTDRDVEMNYDYSPSGTVDLINGSNSSYWLTQFLSDPVWMNEYDIILLNCGLADSLVRSQSEAAQHALENLRNYVFAGGAIYSSDWASEVIRSAFPQRINFHGNDTEFGHSRIGIEDSHQSAYVVDTNLAAHLGQIQLQLNLNLPLWSVLEPIEEQPDDLKALVQANVYRYDPGDYSYFHEDLEVVRSPLIVHFDYGAGRVLYTAAHTESQITADLEQVLDYIIFEL